MNFRDPGGFGRRRGALQATLDITPLVDVVFQLILFFVLTSSIAADESGFSVELPRAKAAGARAQAADLVVAIDEGGRWIFEGKPRSEAELGGLLEERAVENRDRTIIVQADKRVPHGRVVELMDLVKSLGFGKLAIATAPDSR